MSPLAPALLPLALSLVTPGGGYLVESRRLVSGPCCGFGNSVAGLGDLDGDGVGDLAVGAPLNTAGTGMVWFQFLTPSGVARATQGINDVLGGLGNCLSTGDVFGAAVAAIGDLDGDGLAELAVGAPGDDEAAQTGGAVYVLFLNPDGTVDHKRKITSSIGSFGIALAGLGDGSNGLIELAVGAPGDDAGGANRGALWILGLDATGTVGSELRIDSAFPDLDTGLDDFDRFGVSVALLGDLDLDGTLELAAGADLDDTGRLDVGATWVVFSGLQPLVQGPADRRRRR